AWQSVRKMQPEATLEVVQRCVMDRLKSPDPKFGYYALWDYDIFERIPLVQCPSLVMAGEGDGLAQYNDTAAKLFPKGESLLLANTSGRVLDTAAELVAREIESFLSR